MTIVVLALFWLVYCRYLLPMADRLEQVGLSDIWGLRFADRL
jgi:hypothetical protein